MNEVKQIGNYRQGGAWDNPQTGRVYSIDGIAPTLNTCGGGDREVKIVEPIICIGGLQEHQTPRTDGISPSLTAAMGMGGGQTPMIIIDDTQGFDGTRFYEDMCPTLRSQRSGLMTVEPVLHKIGNIYDSKGQNGNIYSNTGISPAILSGTTENKNNGGIGSSNAPKVIVASRGRNPQNPSDRTPGADTEQRLEPNSEGLCNTLTSVQKDNLVLENCIDFYNNKMRSDKCVGTIATNSNTTGSGVFGVVQIKQATQQGYAECKLGGVADLSFPTSKTRRGRVQDNGDTCPTLTATETGICRIETPYRIRKLTPLECWKLMDFTEEDFHKAEKVNSNTQLYKQAGNSIVKAVLMAIFKQMI